MKRRYPIVIENAGRNYSAFSPDVPGCIATGYTIEEVTREMTEALEFHFEGMASDGDEIPQPSSEVTYVEVTVPTPARQSA